MLKLIVTLIITLGFISTSYTKESKVDSLGSDTTQRFIVNHITGDTMVCLTIEEFNLSLERLIQGHRDSVLIHVVLTPALEELESSLFSKDMIIDNLYYSGELQDSIISLKTEQLDMCNDRVLETASYIKKANNNIAKQKRKTKAFSILSSIGTAAVLITTFFLVK